MPGQLTLSPCHGTCLVHPLPGDQVHQIDDLAKDHDDTHLIATARNGLSLFVVAQTANSEPLVGTRMCVWYNHMYVPYDKERESQRERCIDRYYIYIYSYVNKI